MTTSSPPGPDDVAAARKVLDDVVLYTPVLPSRALSEQVGGPVYLKCENLQRTGSFKARGAYLRISRLSDLLGERPGGQHRGVQDDIVEDLARRGHVIRTRRGRRRHA